ncbi:MAG: hypothetical protein KG003_10765 [Bacteroidetes bacterium]|nr:hypothetical protein [Bacteroidota bacterium]
MNRSVIKVCLVLAGLSLAGSASAQKNKKNERFLDFTVGPSLGFRMMTKYTVPDNYKGTTNEYTDSLNKGDRPGQSLNIGVNQMWKKNAFDAFSVGLSYTTLSFRRIVDDVRFGDSVHLLGVIPTIIQAGILQVKYDYRYRYLEIPFMWYRTAEGYGNLRDFDLWYSFGVAPALLLEDKVRIRTFGFSYYGETKFEKKDPTMPTYKVNAIAQLGFRAHYHLYHKLHGIFQPRIRIPVLPQVHGHQTIWIPQFTVDLGLVYLIDKEKDNKK